MQENDLVWKEILELHLQDFIEFFWPIAYRDIDWSKPYVSLEQELQKIAIKDKIGNRYVDKLFKVFLKCGEEQWLLLHIEVQHSKQEDFAKRMLTYFTKLHGKYNKSVASLAVLADGDSNWRPNEYKDNIWGSIIVRSFAVVKILDYKDKEAELRQTENPFGLIVLAQLSALTTKPDQEARLVSKTELFRLLLGHKWSHEKIRNLFCFIDNMLVLNDDLEVKFTEQATYIEEKEEMQLTLSAERVGFRRGEKQGMAQGLSQGIEQGLSQGMAQGLSQGLSQMANLLASLLQEKYHRLPAEYLAKVKNADVATLNAWAINLIHADTLEEVFKE